jgi:hypothetical protein
MKTTQELYRCSADIWKDLPYWKALLVKEGCASRAMDYYRNMGRTHMDNPYLVKEYEDLYLASEDARDFNRKLTKELTDELPGKNNEQGDEKEEHT